MKLPFAKVVGILALLGSGSLYAQGHPFLGGTFTANKAVVVNAQGKVEWEFEAPGVFDVWLLPNKNYLLASRGKGILEVTPEKKVVFHFKTAGETYSCQPLPGGITLVGDNQNGKLLEVDAKGVVIKEISIQTKAKPHGMIRTVRKLASGNYLVSQREDNLVREYDGAGKVMWEYKTGGPMTALRLKNGNTLVSNAAADVLEVDSGGKTVWSFTKKDLAAANVKPLGVAYGLQRLPNGNTVVAYNGVIVEATPDKKVVWSQADAGIKNLMCFQLLDVPGDVTTGEIVR